MKKLLMVLAVMPLMVWADKETVDGIEWAYTINNGEARIDSASTSNKLGAVTIPSTLGGCPVTRIGRAEASIGRTAVRGPKSRVFEQCNAVTSIVIPTNVTSIVDWAFFGCSNLISITIPVSVTNVGRYAFRNCGLKAFKVDLANPNYSERGGLLCTKDGTTLVQGVNGEVTIPSCVKKIGNDAFVSRHGLKSVIMPSCLKEIGRCVFGFCDQLTSVTIPASVTSIAVSAFYWSSLRSFTVDAANEKYSSRNGLLCSKDGSILISGVNGDVVIPSCVNTVGCHAFSECRSLSTLTIPASVTNIEDGHYASIEVKSFDVAAGNPVYCSINGLLCSKDGQTLLRGIAGDVKIPTSVKNIGEYAFFGDRGLGPTSIEIPSSVTNIGAYAFYGCRCLRAISIPLRVVSVGEWAFCGCRGLRKLVLSEGVKSIEDFAFYGCGEIESVTIPRSVKRIGKKAFCGCSSLVSVSIPSSVTTIGEDAFRNTPFYDNMPDGCIVLGGVLRKYKGVCPGSLNIPAVLEGTPVRSIGNCAFAGLTNLTSVTIPQSVTNIGAHAFRMCANLTSLTIHRP